MTQPKQRRTGKQTELRKHLANVLGSNPTLIHEMAIAKAMGKSSAFSHFVAKHLIQSVLGKGTVKLGFTTKHKAAGALANQKSALRQPNKRRVTLAIAHLYKQHPTSDWVQRATLLHALAGMDHHLTNSGEEFFRRVAANPREHDFVKGTAEKYLAESKKK